MSSYLNRKESFQILKDTPPPDDVMAGKYQVVMHSPNLMCWIDLNTLNTSCPFIRFTDINGRKAEIANRRQMGILIREILFDTKLPSRTRVISQQD